MLIFYPSIFQPVDCQRACKSVAVLQLWELLRDDSQVVIDAAMEGSEVMEIGVLATKITYGFSYGVVNIVFLKIFYYLGGCFFRHACMAKKAPGHCAKILFIKSCSGSLWQHTLRLSP